MRCESAHGLLYRLADERLLKNDADEVLAHLDECDGCLSRYRGILDLDGWMAQAADERPTPELRGKLLAAYRRHVAALVRAEARHRRWLAPFRRVAVVGFFVLLSSGITWLTLRTQTSRTAPPPVATTPVRLQKYLPLMVGNSYSTVHPDGRREIGTRVRIVG